MGRSLHYNSVKILSLGTVWDELRRSNSFYHVAAWTLQSIDASHEEMSYLLLDMGYPESLALVEKVQLPSFDDL
jgi:hypothetical protein